jgi:hypothetical protein
MEMRSSSTAAPTPAWSVGEPVPSVEEQRAEANRLISYHAPISKQLTLERTALGSQLIPVTAYILVACTEAFWRYPEMMRRIEAAMPPEEIARSGHRPGSNVNLVYLWSIANFFLNGRKVVTAMDPSADDPTAAYTVLRFWERAARAFHHDEGPRQAWDTGGVVRPYGDDVLTALLADVTPVDDPAERQRLSRLNATLVNYLFLLYFDTRVGAGDTGPYPLPDGRVLLVRDFYRLGESDFWWSEVARDVPYRNLTAALVLDGVELRVTDFGSSVTDPEDYLDRLVGFGLYTTDTPDGSLRPVPSDEIDPLVATTRRVQAQHYRNIAAMSRDEKIRCGAYVYFTFLRPFAEVAGVAEDFDWSVPKALPGPVYQFLSAIDDVDVTIDPDEEYYSPIA